MSNDIVAATAAHVGENENAMISWKSPRGNRLGLGWGEFFIPDDDNDDDDDDDDDDAISEAVEDEDGRIVWIKEESLIRAPAPPEISYNNGSSTEATALDETSSFICI